MLGPRENLYRVDLAWYVGTLGRELVYTVRQGNSLAFE